MNYDVQIGSTIRRGVSYAELIMLPIDPETFVCRDKGDWIQAIECIELTHILARHRTAPMGYDTQIFQKNIDDYSPDEYIDEEIDDLVYNASDIGNIECQPDVTYAPLCSTSTVQPNVLNDEVEEEPIYIPTAEHFKYKQKRKAAIIGICTLGLVGISLMGIGNTWRSNIFAGTSFSANAGIGFVLKCLSFCLLTALIAIPYFIYSVFALIYYSRRLNNLKR